MKTFLQWAKDNGRSINFSEKTIRTGIHGAYPSAYIRAQYPDLYFTPGLASADVDMQNQDKFVRDKAPPDGAP
jgi:hypothetical protein